MNLSLRVKLMASFALFAAVFVTIVTVVFTVKIYTSAVDNQNTLLKTYADITSRNISAGLDFGDKASVLSSYESVKGSLEFIVSLDAYDNVFATYFKDSKKEESTVDVVKRNIESWKLTRKKSWTYSDRNMTCIIIPVVNSVDNEIGLLAMGASTEVITAQLRNDILFSTLILVISIGLGLGVAYVISNLIGSPLTRIVDRLRDIAEGEGDLTKRIDI
ncbi:MAG: hypothetical protein KDC45_13760, partial [Bacteroidetes bacterium]|nr:hypothetical protein [Bacteroidota bacterium]